MELIKTNNLRYYIWNMYRIGQMGIKEGGISYDGRTIY